MAALSLRAVSSSHLVTPSFQLGTVNHLNEGQAPLKAVSTSNLSNTKRPARNRALSWSPVRFDTPTRVSAMPWAKRDSNEGPAKRNSTIDGSVAKAKVVWEMQVSSSKQAPTKTSTGGSPKKGSVSFRQPRTAMETPPVQKSSTTTDVPSQCNGSAFTGPVDGCGIWASGDFLNHCEGSLESASPNKTGNTTGNGTLHTCNTADNGALHTCNSSSTAGGNGALHTCNRNSTAGNGALHTCNRNSTAGNGALPTCNSSSTAGNAALHTCNSSSTAGNGALHTCNSSSTAGNGALHTCNSSSTAGNGALHTCNSGSTAGNAALHTCNSSSTAGNGALHTCNSGSTAGNAALHTCNTAGNDTLSTCSSGSIGDCADVVTACNGDQGLRLRAKKKVTSAADAACDRTSSRRHGFVGADHEHHWQEEGRAAHAGLTVAGSVLRATDSIQSSGGRASRRGGAGASTMGGRDALPLLSNPPSTLASSVDTIPRPNSHLSNNSNSMQHIQQQQQQQYQLQQHQQQQQQQQKQQYEQPQFRQQQQQPQQHNTNSRTNTTHHHQSADHHRLQSQVPYNSPGHNTSQCQQSGDGGDPLSPRKAQSLPGYYARQSPHVIPQTSFREAFANSRSPTPTRRNEVGAPLSPPVSGYARPLQLHVQGQPPNTASPQLTHQPQQQQYFQQPNSLFVKQNVHHTHEFQQLPLEQPFSGSSAAVQQQPQHPNPAAHSTPVRKAPRPQQPLPATARATQVQHKSSESTTTSRNQQTEDVNSTASNKRSKRSLLGIFKRRKKNGTNASSSSDDEQSAKVSDKNKNKQFPGSAHLLSTLESHANDRSNVTPSVDAKPMVRVAPERTMQRAPVTPGQPLGIPLLIPPPGELLKKGVSASHDSIMPAATNKSLLSPYLHYGETSSLGKRCSSIDNVARRERRLALKNRVENLRTKYKDSSSDDDQKSLSSQSMYDSASSLNRTGSLTKRSRAARTERYIRRKSHELETLKQETERDMRSKEAVQARIQEIQRIQQYEAERKRLNEGVALQEAEQQMSNKPRWSANVVYQESSEFNSITLKTPPETPLSNRRLQRESQQKNVSHQNIAQMRHSKSVNFKNKASSFGCGKMGNSFGVTVGEYCSSTSLNRSLTADVTDVGYLKSPRSVSYDCNINKPESGTLLYDRSKVRATPPPPPPRDMNRIVSPADHRPFSYSFENLNQELPNGTQRHLDNTTFTSASQGIRAVLSQSRLNGSRSCIQQSPVPKRAASEVPLPQPRNVGRPPALPPLPSTGHQVLTSETPDQAPQVTLRHSLHYGKPHQVSGVSLSPSSDHSVPASENARLCQVNDAWKQKEQSIRSSKISLFCNPNESFTGDSSRSSTPRSGKNGCSNEAVTGRMKTSLALKADSVSSLSCHSEVSSPPVKSVCENAFNYNSSEKNLNKATSQDAKRSGGPDQPRSISKQYNMNSLERAKMEMQLIIQQERDLQQSKAEKQRQFEEAYLREKKKIERTRCVNFEEALHELEEIYRSLKLDEDDTVEGGSVSDDKAQSRAPSLSKLPRHIPDRNLDDMHYRRCLQGVRNSPDIQKSLLLTGSYLLVSQAHLAASDTELNRAPNKCKREPDIVFDDVSLRNIKQANSIKVIDPQPPFGIPIGPTTQASPNDYLHVRPRDLQKSVSVSRKEPDPAMDDLAFRNLRRDQRKRSFNTCERDEYLSEYHNLLHSQRKNLRSQSADRLSGFQSELDEDSGNQNIRDKSSRTQTPRRVKHEYESKRNCQFFESYRNDADDSQEYLRSNRYNPSWLERANLNDLDIGLGLTSTKAVSQPDIRNAIIREARAPTGGPDEFDVSNVTCVEVTDMSFPSASQIVTANDLTAPRLVKIQTLNLASAAQGLITQKLYKPLDGVYNSKPKPFYISDSVPEPAKVPEDSVTNEISEPVNIPRLEALISTLPNGSEKEQELPCQSNNSQTYTRVYPPRNTVRLCSRVNNATSLESKNTVNSRISESSDRNNLPTTELSPLASLEPQVPSEAEPALSAYQKYEVTSAKQNIMNAIRLSMAMGSAGSEVSHSEQCVQVKNR